MKTTFGFLLTICLITHADGSNRSYPIVDTNQQYAFNDWSTIEFPEEEEPFYGQDAQYAGNQPSYRDNGDGTVSDLVTGLMWTKAPGDDKVDYYQALAGAEICTVGGYSDWRLPSIKELYSLIQFSGLDPELGNDDVHSLKPFIDKDTFDFRYGDEEAGERIIDSQFATRTKYVSTTMFGEETMFGVNFADGRIKGYPTQSRRGGGHLYVLYVRGNPNYGINEFKDSGDGTVVDKATGLTWMKADSGKGMNWKEALEYAEGMEFAGYADWRLPTAKELQSILDYSRSPDTTGTAAIDPVFQATAIKNEAGEKDFGWYWTSTTHKRNRNANAAVYLCFGRSGGFMPSRGSDEYRLIDVHGAGAQRSDPKEGDASRFPRGRGPQGDVIRIDNLVRLVRGGDVKRVETGPEIPVMAQQQTRQRPGEPGGQRAQRQPQEPSRGPGGGSGGNRLFNRFDANGDNQVTREEFTGPAQRFTVLDADGNGVISKEEALNAGPPPGREGPGAGGPGGNRPGRQPRAALPQAGLPTARPEFADKPNFVFIFADDMGWTGTSVEMIPGDPRTKSDFYQTPNLEKLAAQGMRFSAAYAPAAMCTPSRAAVLTGKTPAEVHITTPGPGLGTNANRLRPPTQLREFPESETTIAEALAEGGYASAYFGKWHLGQGNPGQHGFHVHDGSTSNFTPETEPPENPKDIFGLNKRAMDFMRENVEAGRPFLVQLFHYAVHGPFASREESRNKFERLPAGARHKDTIFAGMTWDLDQSIGILMEEIETLGIADNTFVVFLSDNGAASGPRAGELNNAPLNKGKSTLYEGGIRVPMIITGPGIPANSHSKEPVTGCDLFPTFCEWAGIEVPGKIDGTSLASLLSGESSKLDRHVSSLLFHNPHYGRGLDARPTTAIIAGNHKLIKDWESNSYTLFDLNNDLGEQNDLAKTEPKRLKELIAMMEERLHSVDAQLPTINPDYDPTTPQPERRRPGGRGQGRQRPAN